MAGRIGHLPPRLFASTTFLLLIVSPGCVLDVHVLDDRTWPAFWSTLATYVAGDMEQRRLALPSTGTRSNVVQVFSHRSRMWLTCRILLNCTQCLDASRNMLSYFMSSPAREDIAQSMPTSYMQRLRFPTALPCTFPCLSMLAPAPSVLTYHSQMVGSKLSPW